MRYVKATEFLTESEVQLAARLWTQSKKNYAARVCEQIILPNLERINRALGQDNNPMFLASAIEFVMMPVPGQPQ